MAKAAQDDVHIFGVRHHGPGSARRVREALEALQPEAVLIEGPADLTTLLPMLADPAMKTPVALLAYASEDPSAAIFWPFAEFSPETQAALWAANAGAELRFIDLPASWRLAALREERAAIAAALEAERADSDAELIEADGSDRDVDPDDLDAGDADAATAPDWAPIAVRGDPLGALAAAAGYADAESWWRDVIEENPHPGPIFEAVASAMAVLREAEGSAPGLDPEFEAAREAHMRLEIAKSRKSVDGPVAVICGAWHAPALAEKVSATADRAVLKGAPKTKTAATWAPWTAPRLAFESGYGAGVAAPGWQLHLWRAPRERSASIWLARIAAALRVEGHLVSTASLIEAERLAVALAALRERPSVGFEELREAAVACLCGGQPVVWDAIAAPLLVGSEVGEIPKDAPAAPLLEDLQRQQKAVRLKPEALQRELALDLRSDSGLSRSTLLHRLSLLDAPWGRLTDAGKSRGTFRERWVIEWKPEYAVSLVENLIYGSTIAQAADGKMKALLKDTTRIDALAELVSVALTAQLDEAAEYGVARMETAAADVSDGLQLLSALPPLADVVRYGEARATDATHLRGLSVRLLSQAAIALPYAARNLDETAARGFRDALLGAERAAALLELSAEERALWRDAVAETAHDRQAARLVSGAASRLLYEAEALSAEQTATLLERMLSPGATALEAAGFFEGFFDGAGQLLVHDEALRGAVGDWVAGLDEESFVESLPLFRRVLSALDRMERRRLLDGVFGRTQAGPSGLRPAPDGGAGWARHLDRLTAILTAPPKGDAP